MRDFRALLLRHHALALVLAMVALCMKIMVPAGFMFGQNSKVLTVEICGGSVDNLAVTKLVIPMKNDRDDAGHKQGKGECSFASLSKASMPGTDLALLALALAFIFAQGIAPKPFPHPKRQPYMRPPLRGPPALI
jgi:hypothetical protein